MRRIDKHLISLATVDIVERYIFDINLVNFRIVGHIVRNTRRRDNVIDGKLRVFLPFHRRCEVTHKPIPQRALLSLCVGPLHLLHYSNSRARPGIT